MDQLLDQLHDTSLDLSEDTFTEIAKIAGVVLFANQDTAILALFAFCVLVIVALSIMRRYRAKRASSPVEPEPESWRQFRLETLAAYGLD